MESTDLILELCRTLLAASGKADAAPIAATATVNRGVCTGSVTYTTQPSGTCSETDVMQCVREAYSRNGMRINLETDIGVSVFFRVFLEACRNACSENKRVNIVHLLTFEPQVYANDKSHAWMRPTMVNSDFNALPNKVELECSRALLNRRRNAAKAKPYDNMAKTKRVGSKTFVICPKCDTMVPLPTENTAE